MRFLGDRIDIEAKKFAELQGQIDSHAKKQQGLRDDISDMYKTFTENAEKVMDEVGEIRSKVGKETLMVNNTLNEFRRGMDSMLEATEGASKLVGINDDKVAALKADVNNMRGLFHDFSTTTARQKALLECIDKTKLMCNQFNYAVQDLRNQIDTTDAYIENYLPFRTIKELTALLGDCEFDHKTTSKIKLFEARRIKDLYARMVTEVSRVPDFKARLSEF